MKNGIASPAAAEPGILSWKPFLPAGKSGEDAKPGQVNTASVARLSRKLISTERATAFGRRRGPNAQARRRAARLINSLRESLSAFARRLCEMLPEERAASAEELLQKSLRSVGDVDHIHWTQSGCEITFEPWEKRRLRRKNPASLPVLFVAKVDDHLCLTDCTRLKGEKNEASRRESILDRIHAALQRRGIEGGRSPVKTYMVSADATLENIRVF